VPFSAHALAIDGNGVVYAISRQAVWKITPEGKSSILADGIDSPGGIAVDFYGNVYAADAANHVIHKISPQGLISLFAGEPGQAGSTDGTDSARFNTPTGVAVDAAGNVFVADRGNETVRKITSAGVVSTFAGSTRNPGMADGPAVTARFTNPYAITVDALGNIYVSAGGLYGFRKITSDGVVSSLAVTGGFGEWIEAGFLSSIAVRTDGTIFVADGWHWGILATAQPPGFTAPLASRTVVERDTTTFRASAEGSAPISYQWLKDSVAIAGATDSTLTIRDVDKSNVGTYAVRATNAAGAVTSNPARLSLPVTTAEGIGNISFCGQVGSDLEAMVVGFVVTGTGTRPLFIRGLGPTLGAFGVAGFLPAPAFSVYSSSTIAPSNSGTYSPGNPNATALLAAFPFVSTIAADAAVHHAQFGAGTYTVPIWGTGSARGLALAELYDDPLGTAALPSRLSNVACRVSIPKAGSTLIARFTVEGTRARTLLIRGVGPTLGVFGLNRALADPKIELFRGDARLHSNDDWGGSSVIASSAAKVGAFPLALASRDAAILPTLEPGGYSVVLSSVGNSTGLVMLEIYDVF
jgi:hypothetical protein